MKDVSERFNDLIGELDDDVFWEYIRSWKDEQDLCEQMNDWDDETKEQAIIEIKELMEKKNGN